MAISNSGDYIANSVLLFHADYILAGSLSIEFFSYSGDYVANSVLLFHAGYILAGSLSIEFFNGLVLERIVRP